MTQTSHSKTVTLIKHKIKAWEISYDTAAHNGGPFYFEVECKEHIKELKEILAELTKSST